MNINKLDDQQWWETQARRAIAAGEHIPVAWRIEHDEVSDGCMPAGWYAVGVDWRDMPIDWPYTLCFGPFDTKNEAQSAAQYADAEVRKAVA
jgi:hypothetical protein